MSLKYITSIYVQDTTPWKTLLINSKSLCRHGNRSWAFNSLHAYPHFRLNFCMALDHTSSAFLNEICKHLKPSLASRHKLRRQNKKLTSIVSSGPPADSGWNCTPQTFFPDSSVDLIPSTEESLQLMKKGSHPAGNGS